MSSCPICEQPIPGNSEHCDVCGFPTALAIEGLRAARVPEAESAASAREVAERPLKSDSRPTPPPEAELTATLGRGLRERMELLRPLGRDCPDVTNEMCEAALSEASGRVTEALDILRAAQGRLDRQARDAIRRRLEAAEDRRAALERTGVKLDIELPTPESLAPDAGADTADVLRRLITVEQRLAKFESDWKGIQGLVAQIESLRTEAVDLGVPLGEVPAQIDEIRQKLSAGPFRDGDLDSLAQDAARTLMLLHEAIPTSLEEELGRHATTLDALPEGGTDDAPARKLHEEASRHLTKGRLLEASQSVRDLRHALTELEHPAPPPAPAPRAPPAAAPPPDDAMLDVLLKKARSLAGRVRTLPPDSPLALEAAAQIREATDLLRSGRLSDADRTLTELMRTLSSEEGKH
ncbi:MAG: hypothetical protein ACLQD8_01365 [Thermoplasmata archaeon]